MSESVKTSFQSVAVAGVFLAFTASGASWGQAADAPAFRVRLAPSHPWRPPFGLGRVGRPIAADVESGARPAPADYTLTAYQQGKEVGRRPVHFPDGPPYTARVTFERDADELILAAARGPGSPPTELARQGVRLAGFEGEAVARPDRVVNPVDLGTILVPSGWLLLGPGQSATLDVAAISRSRDVPEARLRAWFGSAPGRAVTAPVPLREGLRTERRLALREVPTSRDRDVLHVVLDGGGDELWHKEIPVMLVQRPPHRPAFGATFERLRYDPPISVRDPKTGTYSRMPYEDGWEPGLKDVVVALPNGARFVFWRGSSYIPFWAGRSSTGACYEWAEIISQPEDAVDCVEPLMDKELRYGRVEIVESTPARVHVRWSYQSTDLHYKVWGDEAVEDYYFYPDGLGTRVVNLKSDPARDYELSEFILLTPQGAYPFEVLPDNPVDALFLDGRIRTFRLPNPTAPGTVRGEPDDAPAIYRLRLNQEETLSAISFNPNQRGLPPVVFGPFFDGGQMVTPCYWGSHWPLARGNATGNSIDDRIHLTPCHNSVMSWAGHLPAPLRTAEFVTVDALGRSKPMSVRRWAWLIGMTDDPDGRLRARARSFATPPSLDVRGAKVAFEGYAPERRAIRLAVAGPEVEITIRPGPPCVNPVFELTGAPGGGVRVTLAGRALDAGRFAWDGRTLWLDATIEAPTEMRVTFDDPDGRRRP